MERQITTARHGHILTNTGVWSADGRWIVYDVRSDAAAEAFDGERIERVHIETGEVQVLYRAHNGAKCGVVTYSPVKDEVVFILGPEHPTADFSYGPNRRRGVVVDASEPLAARNLDARDLAPPFTAGALRGGTHVHVFSPSGDRVSFTYNDAVVFPEQRNVGVCVMGRGVRVKKSHPRNHDGEYFSVLVTRTTSAPTPGSDEIRRAFEDAWVGRDGRRMAFIGEVITDAGEAISEVFLAELPLDLTVPGDGPLAGTATALPAPPRGVRQRRLTFTAGRRFAGLCGPRHWVRSSPDGSRIAFLMKDDEGVGQLWTVSPDGEEPAQVTRNAWPIASAFSWSADGRAIAHVMDGSVFVTDVASGVGRRVTMKVEGDGMPRPEACVFSPDGSRVAYVRNVEGFNQVFVAGCP
jgi:dipeptidyl aminopeptidase/acylaminoacyl peptidase